MRGGFTLVEVLVVLLVLGLTAALVAPALLPPGSDDPPALSQALRLGREAASRRAETVYLRIASTGTWTLTAAGGGGSLGSGRLDEWGAPAVTIVVSALGTCGIDARSALAGERLALDPVACEVRAR